MYRKGNTIYGVVQEQTGNVVSYNKATRILGGKEITDEDCDGVVYRKLGDEYFKLNCDYVTPEMFGAKGDGVIDDSTAFEKAVLYKNIYLFNKYKLTKQINVASDCNITGTKNSLIINEYDTEGVLINLSGRHHIRGLNFFCESQTNIPRVFAACIGCLSGNVGYTTIENVSLGNAWVGIDFLGVQGHLTIDNITGFPLYRGIRITDSVDLINITNVFFNPNFFGVPDLSLKRFVFENAVAFEVGRFDWGNMEKIGCFGYKSLINFTHGSHISGAANNIKIEGFAVDACASLAIFSNHDGGISFTGGTGTFYYPYEGVKSEVPNFFCVVENGGIDSTTVKISDNTFYRAEKHCILARNPVIITENTFVDFANQFSTSDIDVIDCIQLALGSDYSIVNSNKINGKNKANNRGIAILSNYNNVSGNVIKGSKAADIYVSASSVQDYVAKQNKIWVNGLGFRDLMYS